jgi:aryl-alcohol dehydrogenase-like predicted oxidoreductase
VDAPDEQRAGRFVHEAVDGGITFFDNCSGYRRGKTETPMGKGSPASETGDASAAGMSS